MVYHLVLRKFDLDLKKLEQKLKTKLIIDPLTQRYILTQPISLSTLTNVHEIAQIFTEEVPLSLFSQESLRHALLTLSKNNHSFKLTVKTFQGVTIPASVLKNKMVKILTQSGVTIDTTASYHILVELSKEKGKMLYRVLSIGAIPSVSQGQPSRLTIVLEHPRLVEELSDFLRLCLIFHLRFIVVHHDYKEAQHMIGKAKQLTKGKLSDFTVDIVSSVKKIPGYKIGFSRHASQNERQFITFLQKRSDQPLVFVFGNDLYGLSQEARDAVDCLFQLTPDPSKPLKGNQALAYVVGILQNIH